MDRVCICISVSWRKSVTNSFRFNKLNMSMQAGKNESWSDNRWCVGDDLCDCGGDGRPFHLVQAWFGLTAITEGRQKQIVNGTMAV